MDLDVSGKRLAVVVLERDTLGELQPPKHLLPYHPHAESVAAAVVLGDALREVVGAIRRRPFERRVLLHVHLGNSPRRLNRARIISSDAALQRAAEAATAIMTHTIMAAAAPATPPPAVRRSPLTIATVGLAFRSTVMCQEIIRLYVAVRLASCMGSSEYLQTLVWYHCCRYVCLLNDIFPLTVSIL